MLNAFDTPAPGLTELTGCLVDFKHYSLIVTSAIPKTSKNAAYREVKFSIRDKVKHVTRHFPCFVSSITLTSGDKEASS